MPGRILIADDMMPNRIILKARLAAAAYDIVQAETGADALDKAAGTKPDLVILADTLPDLNGPALCRRLRAAQGSAAVPVILICRDQSPAARLAALEAGADAVLGTAPDAGLLQARIRNLLRRRADEQELARDAAPAFGFAEAPAPILTPPGQVALIAPRASDGLLWKSALTPLMRDRITLMSPKSVLAELCPTTPPDAFVIGGGSRAALRLISDLRSHRETRRSSILLVQDAPSAERSAMALDLGVSDLVETGFDAVEMALRLRRELARKSKNDDSRAALQDGLRLASTDALTGLHNRRYALRALRQMTQADNGSFAVMVLDLDRFKQVNDRHGHAAGDAVLSETARRMAGCVRRGDILARIGGEEFLAVIRDCDVAQARHAAERLRRVVCDNPVALPGGAGEITVTLSVGLALSGGGAGAEVLIDRADRALYSAKADGRNQVTLSQRAA